MIGGFQIGPFQLAYQQGIGFSLPGQIPVPAVTFMDWYAASYLLASAGFAQNQPPNAIVYRSLPQGTVVAQSPLAGSYVYPGTNIVLTVTFEQFLAPNFDLVIHRVPN
jgi:beta-lactam-binding protein with PASTA domain